MSTEPYKYFGDDSWARVGATVWCHVSDQCFGMFIQKLEHYSDIHLVRAEKNDRESLTKVWMRSDLWPDWWEGVQMDVTAWSDKPRLKFVPRLSCTLNYALRDEIASLLAKALAGEGGGEEVR